MSSTDKQPAALHYWLLAIAVLIVGGALSFVLPYTWNVGIPIACVVVAFFVLQVGFDRANR